MKSESCWRLYNIQSGNSIVVMWSVQICIIQMGVDAGWGTVDEKGVYVDMKLHTMTMATVTNMMIMAMTFMRTMMSMVTMMTMTTMMTMSTTMTIIFIFQEVGGCTQASWRLSDLVQPSTCSFKEVGGYLTRCAHNAASIALNS